MDKAFKMIVYLNQRYVLGINSRLQDQSFELLKNIWKE